MKKILDCLWNNKPLGFLIFLVIGIILNSTRLVSLTYDTNVTFLGMLSIWLMFYCLGFKYGSIGSLIIGGWCFMLALSNHEIIASPLVSLNTKVVVFIVEYMLAFLCFGVGLLLEKRKKLSETYHESNHAVYTADIEYEEEDRLLRGGFLLGVLARLLVYFSVASLPFYRGLTGDGYWQNFMDDFIPLAMEAGLSWCILFFVAPASETIYFLKHVINHEKKDETLLRF